MRVLVANWTRRVVGGVERYVEALLPALVARGHVAALWVERDEPAPLLRVDRSVAGVRFFGPGSDAPAVVAWRPDVVFVQRIEAPEFERRASDAAPAVLFAHDHHGTCATGTKRFAFPALRACRRALGPACLLLHYPRRCGGLDPATAVEGWWRQRARRQLLDRYHRIVVASRYMRLDYERQGVPASRIAVAPLPPAGIRPDPGPPPARPFGGRLLFLGRLTAEKGPALLLDAAAIASRALRCDLRVTIAGDGPLRPQLERRAAARGISAEFPGWVDLATRERLLRAADLLVVPSVWGEPFALGGIEAGCVGLPAAAFDVGGIRDWLEPGETGELAPADPPTAQGLADAIVRALREPGRHAALRAGAWRSSQRFSMSAHLGVLEAVFAAAVRG